ncbi:MAG TPA: hypothetical protein VHW60_14310 [Caulobacteraceae bacterium]|jgi:hypothetical protein|nr:hypothetical protein [Caulobacteraceae bacterium]
MRVYDIALAMIRALVAMDFIRGLADIVYTGIRFSYLNAGASGSAWLSKVELSTWLSPAYSVTMAVVLFAFSKRIASFASKLASPGDTATHF